MPAFMKLGEFKGEASDADHHGWILIDSMTASIFRSIPTGAKDNQRTKGETILSDLAVSRQLDKSSTKLMEACANGTFFKEVEIHLCTTVKNKQELYLTYKLHKVIVSSFAQGSYASGSPLPQETLAMGYSAAEWTYIVVDPKTGDRKGNVPAKYDPGTGRS